MTKGHLNVQDVLRLLRRDVRGAGSQSEWARRTGIERTYLNKVLQGHKPPSPRMIKAVRLQTIVICSAPDADNLLPLLRQAVKEAGSISAWSRKTGIDRSVISCVINGKRAPSSQFFRALKLKKVTNYVIRESETDK
jgi:DNA-binding phage protein